MRAALRTTAVLARIACSVLVAGLACGAPQEAADSRASSTRTDSTGRVPAVLPGDPTVPIATLGRLAPEDDAPSVAAINAIRDTLLRIVAARDTTALLAFVTPETKLSFGGDEGLEGFRTLWLAPDAVGDLWQVLEDILRHGGSAPSETEFVAPWWFTARYPEAADPFTSVVAIDSAVPVYAAPDRTSPVLGVLRYDIVTVVDTLLPAAWTAVRVNDARLGFVSSAAVRSPVGYRLKLERTDGRWRLVFFLAGD
jgi:hypothetical protein